MSHKGKGHSNFVFFLKSAYCYVSIVFSLMVVAVDVVVDFVTSHAQKLSTLVIRTMNPPRVITAGVVGRRRPRCCCCCCIARLCPKETFTVASGESTASV